jgi:hypothetical protein
MYSTLKSNSHELARTLSLARLYRGARVVIAIVLTCLWWSFEEPAKAQNPAPATIFTEAQVKAVNLYGFGRYVEWPKGTFRKASDPFVIGIVGEVSFGKELDEIAAKRTIQERKIVVRRFASADDYKPPCQILFVSRSIPPEQQTALIEKTRGMAVLVVGETPGFAENGGLANFITEGDSVRFEINAETARRSQLRMDAKLLKLGKPVGSPRATATN